MTTSLPRRVLVTTPQWGVAPPEAIESRWKMAFHLGFWQAQPDCPREFAFTIVPDLMVQFSRDRICELALDKDCEFVVMIDDDMIVPHDMVDCLLADDVDIVAPLAFTRLEPHLPVCYAARGGFVPQGSMMFKERHVIRNYPKDTLFECDAVGFGAACIKTEVLRKMRKPWFFTMSGSDGTGEDIFFCRRAQQEAGARIFCDSRIKLLHLGPRKYIGEEDYERLNPEVGAMREALGDWTPEKADQNLMA